MTTQINNYSFWNKAANVKNIEFTTPIPSKSFLAKYIKHNGHVLDLGCGYGRFTRFLSLYGYNVIGVDISRYLIERARKVSPNIKYIVSSIQKCEFEIDGPFDAIFLMGVIENFISTQERRQLIKKIRNSLSKGGIIFLETFIYDNHFRKDYLANRIGKMPIGYFVTKKEQSSLRLFNDTKDAIDNLFEKGMKKVYGKVNYFCTWSGNKQKGYTAIYKKL